MQLQSHYRLEKKKRIEDQLVQTDTNIYLSQ